MFGCDAVFEEVVELKYLECIFANLVTVLLSIAGVGFFVMFLIGGLTYLTAGSDPKKVEGAQSALRYALIGIVVVVCAFLILQFIATFTGVKGILEFKITQ